jgi:hypothetical protein
MQSIRSFLPLLFFLIAACGSVSDQDTAGNLVVLQNTAQTPASLGFQVEVKEGGVKLLVKEDGDEKVRLNIIEADLNQGAQVFSYTTPNEGKPDEPGPFPMVGPNPNFGRLTIEQFWTKLSRNSPFAMVNAAWFDPTRNPTPSPFTIKEENVVRSAGHNMVSEFTYAGHIKLLRINNERHYADIVDFDPVRYGAQLEEFDTIIGGLEEGSPDKIPETYTGRTMIGVRGSIVMIFTTDWSPAANPRIGNGGADYLRKLGALKVMMLSGGDSAQARGVNKDPATHRQQISTYVTSPHPLPLPNVLYVLSKPR